MKETNKFVIALTAAGLAALAVAVLAVLGSAPAAVATSTAPYGLEGFMGQC